MADAQYPNTEVYLITWVGGAGGAFLTSLFTKFVHGVPLAEELKLSNYGNAHDNLTKINWEMRYPNDIYALNHNHSYKHIIPKDPTVPLIFYEHWCPSYDELFYIYPKAKHVIITLEHEDHFLVHVNLFFKFTLQYAREGWDNIKANHPEIPELELLEKPEDITPELLEKLYYWPTWKPAYPFYNGADIPVSPRDAQLVRISYLDMLSNKDKVLSIISNCTERSIPQDAGIIYDKYIEKQKDLVKTRMPDWVYNRYFNI
jgi:hypothetical protein